MGQAEKLSDAIKRQQGQQSMAQFRASIRRSSPTYVPYTYRRNPNWQFDYWPYKHPVIKFTRRQKLRRWFMTQGRTLWQILVTKKEEVPGLANPLEAAGGALVKVDKLDHRDIPYKLKAIQEYRRTLNGQAFIFTDYLLDGGAAPVKIRLNPYLNPAPGQQSHNVLLLTQFDAMPYDDGFFVDVLSAVNKQFVITDDVTGVKDTYDRINGIKSPWQCEVQAQAPDKTLVSWSAQYWDYWRKATDEAGNPFTQFLFVEMMPDRSFTMWMGVDCDTQAITVF